MKTRKKGLISEWVTRLRTVFCSEKKKNVPFFLFPKPEEARKDQKNQKEEGKSDSKQTKLRKNAEQSSPVGKKKTQKTLKKGQRKGQKKPSTRGWGGGKKLAHVRIQFYPIGIWKRGGGKKMASRGGTER